MKKILLKIGLFILGLISLFCTFGTISMLTFSVSDSKKVSKSDMIGGSIVYIVFAIIFIALFVVLLCKYRKLTKADRESKKEIENIQYEMEKQLHMKEVLSYRENLEKLKIQNDERTAALQNRTSGNSRVENLSTNVGMSLSELLLMKIDSLDTSGVYFENVACELLRENGFQNIKMTKTSNDYGIDITAEKDGISYAIQCKCYSSPVGNKAIQEAYAGKEFYKCMIAVVLTNSTFTKNAVETANATQVLLWDRTKLTDMINVLSSKKQKELINSDFKQNEQE